MFQIVERPLFPPHACVGCGATDGRMLDLGVERPPPVLQLYLCIERCVPEIAELTGAASPDVASELRTRLAATLERAAVPPPTHNLTLTKETP